MMNLSSLSKAQILTVFAAFIILSGYVGVSQDIASLLAVITIVISAYFLYSAKREISRTIEVANHLKVGDFEARILKIKDRGEIGDLQRTTNNMIDYIDAFIRESSAVMICVDKGKYYRRILENGMQGSLLNATRVINKAADSFEASQNDFAHRLMSLTDQFDASVAVFIRDLSTSMEELSVTSSSLTSVAQHGEAQAGKLISSSEFASNNVHTVASASEELSASIREIVSQISKSSEITHNAVIKANDANSVIEGLKGSSDKIGEVVSLIRDIAEQTNLLALNATIEAARAGEAGKGFAVVASEVKALASQTSQATEEIEEQVSATQRAAQNTVDSIAEISNIIEEMNQIATAISAAMEEQSVTMEEVVRSTQGAADSTNEVTNVAKGVEESAGSTKNAAKDLNEASSEISRRTIDLREEVEIFLANIKTA